MPFERVRIEFCGGIEVSYFLVSVSVASKYVEVIFYSANNGSYPAKIAKIRFLKSTDLGSLIGNFDCGCSIVWKFSNFPATLILDEINFG